MTNPMLLGFLSLTFAVGIILVVTTVTAQNKIPHNCTKSDMNIAINFILMLGIMLIVLPITQFVCSKYCGCDNNGNLWYKFLIGLFGIILAICGGIVWNGAKDCSGADDVSTYGIGIMVTGIILTILLGVYQGYYSKSLTEDRGFGSKSSTPSSSKSSTPSIGDVL